MGLWRQLASYPRLLMAANPSRLDLSMLVVAFTCAVASGVPFPLIGIVFGQLLNDFNEVSCDESAASTDEQSSSYQGRINDRILIIVYLAIAQFVLIYAHLLLFTLFGSRLTLRLQESYLANLLRQEPSYFDKVTPGEVASRLTVDCQAIRSGTSEKVGICLASLSFFVASYVVAFVKDAKLAGILISLVPAYFLMTFVGSYYIEKYAGLMSDYAAAASSIASEGLRNLVVVQAFTADGRLEEKFAKALSSSKGEGLKKALAVGIQSGVLYFVAYSANGLAFWQGSRGVADLVEGHGGGTTVGATFTVIFVLIEATLLLSQVAPFIHLFSGAAASFEKLNAEIQRPSQIDGTTSQGNRLTEADGTIELKDVSFRYPSRPEVLVLDQVNINILPQKHTAIVGLSGSGKSTIASLIGRLYDPTEGQILLNGKDIQDYNTHDLRSHVSLVQQEPCLLDRSILENIAYGLINSVDPDHADLKALINGPELAHLAIKVSEGETLEAAAEQGGPQLLKIANLVQKAAALTGADEFINRLPDNYGSSAGPSGRLLSGGQKQRIALSRALVKDPSILVLDEATAALDSTSERYIQRALDNFSKNRTVLTIAHRLSTIKNADYIVVLHAGHVVEEGSHSDLMARDGQYANMVGLQTAGAISTSRDGVQSEKESLDRSSSSGSEEDLESKGLAFEKAAGDVIMDKKDGHKTKPSSIQAVDAKRAVDKEEEDDEGQDEDEETPPTPKKSVWALMKGYAPTLRPHLLVIFLALLGSVVVGGSFSGEAVIFGNTVGSLNLCKSPESITSKGEFFGLMFFVLAIIELFANIISWTGFGWVSENVVCTVRILSFRSLFQQDLQWHQSENRTPAKLLSFITRDGAALAGLSGSVIGTLLSITINLFAAIILTTIIAWKISLVCLALVPLLLGAGLAELHILGKFEEKHESAYSKSVDIGTEAIHNIKTVASLSLENTTLLSYRHALREPRKETFKVTWQASLFQAVTYFFGNCVNALAYWWGSKQIIAGNYTQVQFLIVVFSLLVSAMLWSQMFALAPELSNARGSMARILGLIEIGRDRMTGYVTDAGRTTSVEAEDVEAASKAKMSEGLGDSSNSAPCSVRFQDVHFSYPGRADARVLTGLNINFPAGKLCALVGPSGAGKSTIISLVERFYRPQSGAILLDGIDLAQRDDISFRDQIGLVPQDSVLFDGSVQFNIGLGARPGHEATLEEVQAACRLANIHDTIEALPEGYNTLCGSNGNQFSGGQKQRLSIARALVRKPRLLILDEPTSALDAESEKLLQEGLEKASVNITVIVIAHRLHTIKKADCIFLIESGQCVDSGTHNELLERSQSYRENVLHQTIAEP